MGCKFYSHTAANIFLGPKLKIRISKYYHFFKHMIYMTIKLIFLEKNTANGEIKLKLGIK